MTDWDAMATRYFTEGGAAVREAHDAGRIEERGNGWYRLDGRSVHGFPMLFVLLYDEWLAAR